MRLQPRRPRDVAESVGRAVETTRVVRDTLEEHLSGHLDSLHTPTATRQRQLVVHLVRHVRGELLWLPPARDRGVEEAGRTNHDPSSPLAECPKSLPIKRTGRLAGGPVPCRGSAAGAVRLRSPAGRARHLHGVRRLTLYLHGYAFPEEAPGRRPTQKGERHGQEGFARGCVLCSHHCRWH
jgi:hypothetical protein